jgi:hypothetical protein
MEKITYRGWEITFNPKPIADYSHDYDFVSPNHDGGTETCGTASSVESAMREIDEREGESDEIPTLHTVKKWEASKREPITNEELAKFD